MKQKLQRVSVEELLNRNYPNPIFQISKTPMKENFKGKQFIDNQSLPVELTLPKTTSFSDFTGKTLERLEVMVGAAKKREEALKHILLCGPPD